MDTIRQVLFVVLVVVHVAAVLGLFWGLLHQSRVPEKSVNALMRDSAGTAVVTGLALVAVVAAGDTDVQWGKVAVKAVVGIAILVLVLANLRRPVIPTGVWGIVLGLAVADLAVALVW